MTNEVQVSKDLNSQWSLDLLPDIKANDQKCKWRSLQFKVFLTFTQ